MASFIYKPVPSNPGKGPVFLAPDSTDRSQAPTISGPNGQKYTGTYVNTNEGRHQWTFPTEIRGMQGLQVSYGGKTSSISSGGQSYEGDDFTSWQPRDKGSVGYAGSYAPNQMGYGFSPADLTGMFPGLTKAKFDKIKNPRYDYTDPLEFATKFGDFNRDEIRKNFDVAKDLGQGAIEAELEGLQTFVPGATALKRNETSLDNQFNQAQRTGQLESVIPGIGKSFGDQRARAESYARGELPDSIEDRAFELGSASNAADAASAGGFGARSSVSKKISQLMSATQRLDLSRYGDQLLSSNLNQSVNTLLAPTEYSNAGSQINVNPRTNAGEAALNSLGMINNATMISTGDAYSSTVQQEQFRTGLRERTAQFNASGAYNASATNAAAANNFALNKFGYQTGYAGSVAGAAQTDLNTQVGLQQQEQYGNTVQNYAEQVRSSEAFGAGAQGVGSILAGASTILGSLGIGGSGATSGGEIAGPSGDVSYGTEGSLALPDSFLTNEIPPFSYESGSGGPNYSLGISDPGAGSGVPMASQSFGGGGSSGSSYGGGLTEMSAPLQSFARVSGLSDANFSNPKINAGILTQSAGTLRTAGLSSSPAPGMVPIGNDTTGRPVYSSEALLKSDDTGLGSNFVEGLKAVVDPFGTFSREDSNTLQKVATVANDGALLANLTAMQANGDTKGFVNTLLARTSPGVTKALGAGEKTQETVGAAFTAYQLAQNWDRMSPAQKSLGIASLGIQGFKTATGKNLAQVELVKPTYGADGSISTPGLSLGQGLALFQAGYNTYSLVKNWNQLTGLQKIAGGTSSAASIANMAKSLGMLGTGTSGAAVANITAEGLASAGWSSASNLGVGAIVSETGASLPAGYSVIAQNGTQAVAIPSANAATSSLAQAGNLLGTTAGIAGIGMGAYQVSKGWGQGGSQGALNGALGGSAIAAGLYTLGATNPVLLAGVVAYSVLGNTVPHGTAGGDILNISKEVIKGGVVAGPVGAAYTGGKALVKAVTNWTNSGKSNDQSNRDFVRSRFKEVGLIGKDNWNITLADGSTFDIGVDGHGGKHSIKDPSKLVGSDSKRGDLNAWDTDYTNDLDYTAGMGGNTLSRLISGRVDKGVNQLGGQLGNGLLGKDGFGKEYTKENFEKVASNFRAVASQIGIKSKSDGYQLANQAYAEGRITEQDLISAHQTFNMMYDKEGYGTGQKLMSGRFRGIEAAKTSKPAEQTTVQQPSTEGMSRQDLQVLPPLTGTKNLLPNISKNDLNQRKGFSSRSKEEVIRANRMKFNKGAVAA